MGFGTSIFLIAIGAILDFAVKVQTKGFNVNKIGLILMIVGIVGLVLSMFFWGSWGGFAGSRRTTRVRRPLADAPGTVEYVEDERRY